MSVIDKYNNRVDKVNSLLCVGLDSEISKIPEKFRDMKFPQWEFNRYIIDQTAEFTSAIKINMAFYEAYGDQGLRELKMTADYLQENYPDIFTIGDAKRADISSSNQRYAQAIFDWLGLDCITLHPYLGKEALLPFLNRVDKGSVILCRTSNPGAGELQDLLIDGKPLWQVVAEKVRDEWNGNDNCMLVVGATYSAELKKIRELVPKMTFLVPGLGFQGGGIEETVKNGLTKDGKGMILVSARGIIFSEHPGLAAEQLKNSINNYR